MAWRSSKVVALVLAACGGDDGGADGATDAALETADAVTSETTVSDAPASDSAGADVADTIEGEVAPDTLDDTSAPDGLTTDVPSDAPTDVGPSCLAAGHAAGERYPAGDRCNFCLCEPDGAAICTSRTCPGVFGGCEYEGADRAYGERFASSDGCNECVCAASGLACTRRCSGLAEEGAILLESLTEACGDDPTFTGEAVLAGFPYPELVTPLVYARDRELYPETRVDTTLTLRVVYEPGGYVVCRIPSPEQPAIDIEVSSEWLTEDLAFDEGFHTYLRRNNFGFVDGWFTVASAPVDGLDGAYRPACLDPNGFGFSATYYADGTADGSIFKVCEVHIALDVGTFQHVPAP